MQTPTNEHLGVIRIRNAVFYAYHGVLQEEQNVGGKFEIDVDMWCDFSAAAETDSLRRTVDYEKVYAYLLQIVLAKKYYLIEALAHMIAVGLLRDFPPVERVMVRVRKPHPPVRGVVDHVEVEITLSR
ncbi:MAG: dihydroneopterin aldolase [Ignavibacteria bacterium]|nr:dihydroneopterin aldolase [Ignavibacteria bacterium]